ncbi:hypothetical protein D3C86_1497750 [compost metagenome]
MLRAAIWLLESPTMPEVLIAASWATESDAILSVLNAAICPELRAPIWTVVKAEN